MYPKGTSGLIAAAALRAAVTPLYEIRLIGSRHCERSEAIHGQKMPTAVQLLPGRHGAKAPRDDGSELPAGFGMT